MSVKNVSKLSSFQSRLTTEQNWLEPDSLAGWLIDKNNRQFNRLAVQTPMNNRNAHTAREMLNRFRRA